MRSIIVDFVGSVTLSDAEALTLVFRSIPSSTRFRRRRKKFFVLVKLSTNLQKSTSGW